MKYVGMPFRFVLLLLFAPIALLVMVIMSPGDVPDILDEMKTFLMEGCD